MKRIVISTLAVGAVALLVWASTEESPRPAPAGPVAIEAPVSQPPTPKPADPQRLLAVLSVAPELHVDTAKALMAASDQARERAEDLALLEEGVESNPGAVIRQAFNAVENSEGELLAYFETNQHLFGRRTFEQSRYSVDRLLRVQKTRAHLGIQ